ALPIWTGNMRDAAKLVRPAGAVDPARDRKNGSRDVECRGRAADLIVHDPQRVAAACKPEHRPNEVLAEWRIHPGGSQDDMPAVRGGDRKLACKLRGTIDVDRSRRVILHIGSRLRAAEKD